MIYLEGVVKHYGSGNNPIRAVDDVSLTIASGELAMIVGPSGSGKTTLLNLVGGMTRPARGTIEIAGQRILQMTDRSLSRFRAEKIGFVFQFPTLLAPLNLLDNVCLPIRFSGRKPDKERATRLLERVGLAERAGSFAYQLSEGQRRRACIARALMNCPELLLWDEPTGDLDRETEKTILDLLIEEHEQGATILLTTHSRDLLCRATQTLRMDSGRIERLVTNQGSDEPIS